MRPIPEAADMTEADRLQCRTLIEAACFYAVDYDDDGGIDRPLRLRLDHPASRPASIGGVDTSRPRVDRTANRTRAIQPP